MIFDDFPYIAIPNLTDGIDDGVKRILCVNGKKDTYEHVCAVARENAAIAAQYGLDTDKCRIAGLLHDISAVIKAEDMLSYAKANNMALCTAEEKFPFLLHQRISEIAAREHFNISDRDILSAISCHTTLRINASAYEMSLFIADKLAWDVGGTPPYYGEVKAALEMSLEKACFVYMKYMEENGEILCPHYNWTAAYKWLEADLIPKGTI